MNRNVVGMGLELTALWPRGLLLATAKAKECRFEKLFLGTCPFQGAKGQNEVAFQSC